MAGYFLTVWANIANKGESAAWTWLAHLVFTFLVCMIVPSALSYPRDSQASLLPTHNSVLRIKLVPAS
jgi:hypothetical protein